MKLLAQRDTQGDGWWLHMYSDDSDFKKKFDSQQQRS